MRKKKILVVEDDKSLLNTLQRILKREFDVVTASSASDFAVQALTEIDLVLLDIRLDDDDPKNKDGLNILNRIRSDHFDLPVVMMSAYGDLDIVLEAMHLGANDFIMKNRVDIYEFQRVVDLNLERSQLARKVAELQESISRLEPGQIMGESPEIREVKKQVDMAASDAQATVLIGGPTGTGKELVARAIHSIGPRRCDPFVPVAIAALNSNLVESELFGHEKGSFTGAAERKIGYIERANGGILFLDEIGDLELALQAKLLRFLESRTFCRVGATKEIHVDIQLIAATLRNLRELVDQGKFREDLYYRLKTIEINIPSLSARKSDIPILAQYFLDIFRSQGRIDHNVISQEAMEKLLTYPWPGNVRELRSSIERAIIYSNYNGHNMITFDDLPLDIQSYPAHKSPALNVHDIMIPRGGVDVRRELFRIELAYIESALKSSNGKKTKAWKTLGYRDRYALWRKIKKAEQEYPDLLSNFPYLLHRYQINRQSLCQDM